MKHYHITIHYETRTSEYATIRKADAEALLRLAAGSYLKVTAGMEQCPEQACKWLPNQPS